MRHRRNVKRKSTVRNINYFIGEAFTSIWRNKLMSISSMATIASCVFIVVFSIAMVVNVSSMFRQLEATTGIMVWIDDGLEREQVNELRERILEIEHVSRVTYVSADEGLEWMIEQQQNPALERFFANNPLRAGFEIELTDTRQTDYVVEQLELLRAYGAADVNYLGDVLDIFIMLSNVITVVSIIIIVVLGVLSVVIVMNTIKLTVNNRRNEISIMKYVGATDAFVRWPFIIEGIIIGLIGAVVPVAIVGLAYGGAIDMVYSSLQFMEDFIVLRTAGQVFPWLAPAALLIGAGIGFAGSVVSIRKYLKA